MQEEQLSQYRQSHDFSADTRSNEKRVNAVFALTTVTMVVEIAAGVAFGSMALLADGWHMFTHSAAFAITMFTYWYAKKHKDNDSFSFGTGKVTSLGGFASAVALAVVAVMMALESVGRFFSPHDIHFKEAIIVAVIGLIVNVISAVLLHGDEHHHHHGHSHSHSHSHDHHDHHDHHHHSDSNMKAAYFHVLADMLTSVFAILALIVGQYLGWLWLDATMGIVGAVVIIKWAYGLIGESSHILLDRNADVKAEENVRHLLASLPATEIVDLHVWKVSDKHKALMVSLVVGEEQSAIKAQTVKALLKENHCEFDHVTVEINPLG